MPVYQYKGQHFDLPDGLTNEQALSKIKAHLGETQEPAPVAENQSAAETARLARQAAPAPAAPSVMQQMFGVGSPAYSFLRGAVIQPALGVNELLSRAFPEPVRQAAASNIQREAQAYEQGRQQVGREGFDVPQLAGAILSPVNRIAGGTQAATAAGRVGQGVASGALYGGITPTSGNEDQFVAEKLLQVGLGGIIGGAVPLTVEGTKSITNLIRDLPISQAAKDRALKKYVVDLAGGKPEEAAQALRQAEEIVAGSRPTAAEALSSTPSAARLVREQGRIASALPEGFITRAEEQAAARQTALTGTFGTAVDLARMVEQRTATSTPMREQALNWADVYGKTAPKLQTVLDDVSKELKKTLPRLGDFSSVRQKELNDLLTKSKAFKQAQIKSLNDNGFFPLSVEPLVNKINQSRATVGERSNELLQAAQSRILDKLQRFSNEDGLIPSKDLYNIRKEIGEDIQAFLTSRGNPSFSGQATAVEKTLKAQIDDAITQASGSNLWKDYLKNFSKYSEKINQMEVGQELQKRLGGTYDVEAAGRFAIGLRDAPALIKRATGQNRFEKIEDILTKEQTATVNRVYADLLRKNKAEELAKKVKQTGQVQFNDQELPQFLDRAITVAKSILNTIRRGSQKELDAKLAELMLEPQKLAAFLETLPKKDASVLGQVIATRVSPEVRDQFNMFLQQTAPTEGQVTRGLTQQLFTQE